jgi:hypothetical protein
MHQPHFGNIVFQFLFSSELLQDSFSFEGLTGRLYKQKVSTLDVFLRLGVSIFSPT